MAKTLTFTDVPQPTSPSASAVAGGSLAASTTYYYRVIKVYNAAAGNAWWGKSLPSDEFSVTTDATNKTARITFTCTDTSGSYRIFRSTTSEGYNGVYMSCIAFYPTDALYNTAGTVTFDDTGYALGGNNYYESDDLAHGRLVLSGSSSGDQFSIKDLYDADVAGGWGVIHRLDANTFKVNCFLVGDSGQYWTDYEKTIILADGMLNPGRWTLGKISGDNNTSAGCNIIIRSTWLGNQTWTSLTAYRTNFIYLYPKNSSGNDITTGLGLTGGGFDLGLLHDCTVDRFRNFLPRAGTTVFNTIFSRFDNLFSNSAATFDTVKLLSGSRVWQISGGTTHITGRGVYTESTNIVLIVNAAGSSLTIIDSISDGDILVSGTADQTGFMLYDQISYNLNVTDDNEDPLENVSVKIYNKNDTLVVDELTDVDGNIDEQFITRRDRTVDNTTVQPFVEYSPFTVIVSKPGYETYQEIISYDISEPVVKTLELKKQVPVMIDTQTGGIKVKANPENYGKDRDVIL